MEDRQPRSWTPKQTAKRVSLLVALVTAAALTLGAGPARAQRADNKGTEFVLGFMQNHTGSVAIELFLTGDTATSGTVSIPGLEFSTPFSVTPGTITTISLPTSVETRLSDSTVANGVLVTAEDEIVVYGLNQRNATTDAFLGLPTDILATDYLVLAYAATVGAGYPSEFMIAGVEDATSVTITPSVSTGSRTAGVPFDIGLDRLDVYQLQTDGSDEDLSGTVITSDKPIAVFGGVTCVNIPSSNVGACDHLVEQLPPTETWGVSFLTVPLATRTAGDVFRIMARDDGTEVRIDGALVATIDAGQFYQTDLASDTFHEIDTSGPALVMQYSKGTSADGVTSDPFMMMIPPTQQFLRGYTVTTPDETPVAFSNHVNVVVRTADAASCTIDGGSFTSAFTPIGTSGFSGAQEPVAIGSHTLACPSEFGAYAYGFASADSYGYPGGLSLEPIANETCELTPDRALNPVGTDHTVTARLTESVVNPLAGVQVTFNVNGSNEGAEGTCSPNPDCITGDNGEISFTYADGGGGGVDQIHGSFVNSDEETVACIPTPHALKFWDEDCNENGVPDTCDLSCGAFGEACSEFAECGASEDLDENGVPDECAPPVGETEISLSPARAHLDPGVEHTLTARLFNASAEPPAGVQVDFEVVAGQNAGQTSSAATDDNGEASFTYSGTGDPGWDLVVARATVFERDLESNQALVLWGNGIYPVSDWAEALDLWTYEDDLGEDHTIGFLAARSEGVHVLDVTNPLDFQFMGIYRPESCDTDGGTADFYADDVTFVEAQQVIHVSAGVCGVHIVDVAGARNPDNGNRPQAFVPQRLEAYDAHVLYSSSWAEAVAVYAGTAYVADYDALRIFDVSSHDGDPTTSDIGPELASIPIDPDNGGPVGSVVLYEDADNERLLALVATGDGMRIVNVNTPGSPTLIGTYQHPAELGPNAISQDIAMGTGPYDVLLPAWVGGLSVVDIGNTLNDEGEPEEVDTLSTDVAYYTAVPYRGRIYATEGIGGLRVVYVNDGFLDTVDSLDPIEVGNPGEDWAWDVVVADCVAYVTFGNLDSGEGGLQLTPLPLEACEDASAVQSQGAAQADADQDGVADAEDNCLEVPNADQTDVDLDGFGNACDADYDNNGGVGNSDYNIFTAAYEAIEGDRRYDPRVDHNADGGVGMADWSFLIKYWGRPPGPSGLACAGSVPCP